MSRLIKRLIYGFVSLLFALVVGYSIYMLVKENSSSLITATVEMTSVNVGITAQGLIVRDEKLINMESGYCYIPLANTGDRVSAGKAIAACFSSENDRDAYLKKNDAEAKIELLQSAKNNAGSDTNIADYNKEIYRLIREISGCGSDREVGNMLSDLSGDLEKAVVSREYLLGNYDGIDSDIAALKTEVEGYSASIEAAVKYLKTDKAGYISLVPDGMENYFQIDTLADMTPEQFEEAIGKTPQPLENVALGKMIYGYDWYIAMPVKSEEAGNVANGDSYTVQISGESVVASVEAVNKSSDGTKALIILKSNVALSDMTASRRQSCKLILSTYEGFKIPIEALRVVDGQAGVFVLEGAEAKFKPAEILYKSANFYVVKANTEDKDALFLYDKVIINSKNLYDGKVVG